MKMYRMLPILSLRSYATLMKTIPAALKAETSDPAQFRLKVLTHTQRFGWQSASHAYNVARSTIFLWQKTLRDGGGRVITLVPKSTTPKQRRRMTIDLRLLDFLRIFRDEYGNIGKNKIKPFLDAYARSLGTSSYGITKIGTIIRRNKFFDAHTPRKAAHRSIRGIRRRYAPKNVQPGHVEMDSLTIHGAGILYKFITVIDVATRFAWCQLVPSLAAMHAMNALRVFSTVYAHPVHTIQTDNGSEFLGVFHTHLEMQDILHEFSYPRSPKINGVVERFNRTIQEEFLNRSSDLGVDMARFKDRLASYLSWYNDRRPHWALKYQTPAAYLAQQTEGQP